MTPQPIQIDNGPSKFTLMSRFADRYDELTGNHRDEQFVTFITNLVTSLTNGGALGAKVYLTSLTYESGGGHCWLFQGTLTQDCRLPGIKAGSRIKGFYSTKTHKGTLELLS